MDFESRIVPQPYLDVVQISAIGCPEYDEALKSLEYHGWSRIITEPTTIDTMLLKQFFGSVQIPDEGRITAKAASMSITITAEDFNKVYELKNTGGAPSAQGLETMNKRMWNVLVADRNVKISHLIPKGKLNLKNYLLASMVHHVFINGQGVGNTVPAEVAATIIDLNSSKEINWSEALFRRLKKAIRSREVKYGRLLTGIILRKLGRKLPIDNNDSLVLETEIFNKLYLASVKPASKKRTRKQQAQNDSEEEEEKEEEQVSPLKRKSIYEPDDGPISSVLKKRRTTGVQLREPAVKQLRISEAEAKKSMTSTRSAKDKGKSVMVPSPEEEEKQQMEKALKASRAELKEQIEDELMPELLNKAQMSVTEREQAKIRQEFLLTFTENELPEQLRKEISAEIERRTLIALEREGFKRKYLAKYPVRAGSQQDKESILRAATREANISVAKQYKTTTEQVEKANTALVKPLISLTQSLVNENAKLKKEIEMKELELVKANQYLSPMTYQSLSNAADRLKIEERQRNSLALEIEGKKISLKSARLSAPQRKITELELEVLELKAVLKRNRLENSFLRNDVQKLTHTVWINCAKKLRRKVKKTVLIPGKPVTSLLKPSEAAQCVEKRTYFQKSVLGELLTNSSELKHVKTTEKYTTLLEIIAEPTEGTDGSKRLEGTYAETQWYKLGRVVYRMNIEEKKAADLLNAELPTEEPPQLKQMEQVMYEVLSGSTSGTPSPQFVNEAESSSSQAQAQHGKQIMVIPSPTPLNFIPPGSLELIHKSIETLAQRQERQERDKAEDRIRLARVEEDSKILKEEQQLIRQDQKIVLQNQKEQSMFNSTLMAKLTGVFDMFSKTISPTVSTPQVQHSATISVPLTIEESQPVAPIVQSAAPPPTNTVSTLAPSTSSSQPPPPTTQAPSNPPPPLNDDKRGEETEKMGEEKEQDKESATTPMDEA